MMEFELRGDLARVQSSVIDANFDELRAWLRDELAAYRVMVVTEDVIPQAKTYRANIRKIAQRIDEQRKAVKAAYNAPLKVFEDNCKELTALCDEAAGALDAQVKAFDEERRRARENALRQVFELEAADLTEMKLLSWEGVLEPHWLNATVSEAKALAEMREKLERRRSDVEAIRALDSPFETTLLASYAAKGDLGAALSLNAQLKERAAAEETRAKAREAAASEEVPTAEPSAKIEAVAQIEEAPRREAVSQELHELDFRVWATEKQIAALRAFLLENGIRYGRVPKKD